MNKRLSLEQESAILSLRTLGHTQEAIAQVIGCSQPEVSRVLTALLDTRQQAKAIVHNGAATMAKRVVNDAEPELLVKVLEQIEVLPPAQRQSSGNTLNVVIGMPGQPAGPDPFTTLSPVTFASKQLGTESVSD